MTIPEDESLRYKVLHDLDFDLIDDEAGVDPSTLSRWTAQAPTQSDLASGAIATAAFGTPTAIGSDIALDVDPTVVNILTDGVYGLTCWSFGSGAITTLIQGLLITPGFSTPAIDYYSDAVITAFDLPLSFGPWFLPAGATVQVTTSAYTSVSTWELAGLVLWIQRLA